MTMLMFRIGVDSYGLKPLEAVIGFPRQLDLRTAGIARRDLELALELAGEVRYVGRGSAHVETDDRALAFMYVCVCVCVCTRARM
jgi:hypothetical protein